MILIRSILLFFACSALAFISPTALAHVPAQPKAKPSAKPTTAKKTANKSKATIKTSNNKVARAVNTETAINLPAKLRLEQLEQAIDNRQDLAAAAIAHSFSDHPLEAYAQYLYLKSHTEDKTHYEALYQYLSRFNDTSWAESLRQAWASHLAKQQEWPLLTVYAEHFNKGDARCYTLQAQYLALGAGTKWQQEAIELWLEDGNPTAACRDLYATLESNQLLTAEHWENKLFKQAAARKLDWLNVSQQNLPETLRSQYQPWLDTLNTPSEQSFSAWMSAIENAPEGKKSAWLTLLLSSVENLSKTQWQTSIELWSYIKQRLALTAEQSGKTDKFLYALAAKKQPDAATSWLSKIPIGFHDEATLLPLIKEDWRHSQWSDMLTHLSWLNAQEQQANIWQYWRARALEATGQVDEAKSIYQTLAQKRSYYGFMAADKLGLAYQLNSQQVTADQLSQALATPLAQRLQALYEVGLKDVAWKEWQFARQQGHVLPELIPGFAQAAQGWGWHSFAALSMNEPQHWDYLSLRFAMPYRDLLESKANQHDISLAWAYGIMRRESAYSTDVKSRSGAMGLMQLMPKTAKALEPIKNLADVYEPSLNIHLGTKLLGQLKRDFSGNLILASAAYNAGGFRVKQWLKQNSDLASDQWIELIPYKETRDYVKAVMEYMLVFERLDQAAPKTLLSDYMPPTPSSIKVVENNCNPLTDWCL